MKDKVIYIGYRQYFFGDMNRRFNPMLDILVDCKKKAYGLRNMKFLVGHNAYEIEGYEEIVLRLKLSNCIESNLTKEKE